MRAVILSGGKGTRLLPYTTVFPKPLVPIGHRPILDIIIRQLAYYGFSDVVLALGHLAELIQAYFYNMGKEYNGVRLAYVKEVKPMGTAGALSTIPELDSTFLAMNGDILSSLNYSKLVDYHKEKKGIMTIAVLMKEIELDFGVIELDKDCLLNGYTEKPKKTFPISMGVYVYEPAVLQYIEQDTYLDLPDLVLRLLDNGEKVVGYPCNDFWMDIGRQEDYLRAQEEFEKGKDIFLPKH